MKVTMIENTKMVGRLQYGDVFKHEGKLYMLGYVVNVMHVIDLESGEMASLGFDNNCFGMSQDTQVIKMYAELQASEDS